MDFDCRSRCFYTEQEIFDMEQDEEPSSKRKKPSMKKPLARKPLLRKPVKKPSTISCHTAIAPR